MVLTLKLSKTLLLLLNASSASLAIVTEIIKKITSNGK